MQLARMQQNVPAPACHGVPTPSGRWNEIVIDERFFSYNFCFGTFTLDYDDGAFTAMWESQCIVSSNMDSHRSLRILWKIYDRSRC